MYNLSCHEVNEMKKITIGIISVVVLGLVFFWWQQYQQDKAFMDSLKLHQPIELTEVTEVYVWKSIEDPKGLIKGEEEKVIKGFNDAEPGKEKGDFYDLPTHEAGIIIKLKSGYEINIYYVEGMIDVTRTDVKPKMKITYRLNDAPVLNDYFEKLLD